MKFKKLTEGRGFELAQYVKDYLERNKDYEVKILNPSRPGKKLLVLDVDYTIFGKDNPIIVTNCHE